MRRQGPGSFFIFKAGLWTYFPTGLWVDGLSDNSTSGKNVSTKSALVLGNFGRFGIVNHFFDKQIGWNALVDSACSILAEMSLVDQPS